MRIAIASEHGFVSAHFGRCPEYVIADIDAGKVVKREMAPNPGHGHGVIPHFLSQRGVNCIIAGGMGPSAAQLCQKYGITPILGVQGSIDEVIDQYLQGNLKGSDGICTEDRQHRAGECNHHRHGQAD